MQVNQGEMEVEKIFMKKINNNLLIFEPFKKIHVSLGGVVSSLSALELIFVLSKTRIKIL